MNGRLVFKAQAVAKAFSPEEQAGLQNIMALINQMLQSGMAQVQPEAGEGGAPVAMGLEDQQQAGRMGGPAPNEEPEKMVNAAQNPGEEADEETKKPPFPVGKDVSGSQAKGAEGTGFTGKKTERAPFQSGGKGEGTEYHEGMDASTTVEGRLNDIPLQDEENLEDVKNPESNIAKMNALRTLAKAMGLAPSKIAKALGFNWDRMVSKSQQEGLSGELAEIRKTQENLIAMLTGQLGMVDRSVSKSTPVLSAPSDTRQMNMVRQLAQDAGIVQKDAGTSPFDPDVKKSQRESILGGLAQMGYWPGKQ